MAVIGGDGLSLLVGDGAATEGFIALRGLTVIQLEISQRGYLASAVAAHAWQQQVGTANRQLVLEAQSYATDEAPALRLRTLAMTGDTGNFKLELQGAEAMALSATLFNPSDQSLTHQLNETTIRQQIEQIMATNYVLANCHLIDAESYRNSFRALIVYAQRTKFADSWVTAEEKVRSIAESASASYSLLYYRTKCDDPKLAQTTRQLIDWQNAYLDQ
jgi:hypothetical protein